MAFQFPASPILGQVFTPIPGVSYKWNGTGWAPFSTTFITAVDAQALVDAAVLALGQSMVGSIFWRHVAQSKELACNGQSVLKASYPDLWTYAQLFLTADQVNNPGMFLDFSATHFKLPLLNGYFLRSVGSPTLNGSAVSGIIGAAQGSAVQGHQHSYTDVGHVHNELIVLNGAPGRGTWPDGANDSTGPQGSSMNTGVAGIGITIDGVTGSPQDANESRPYSVTYYAVVRALP